jgi:hypothetical protein
VTYYTTPAFLECAKAVSRTRRDAGRHATFYGEGLVQHMARKYVRTPKMVQPNLAIEKPELISANCASSTRAASREPDVRRRRRQACADGAEAVAELKTTSILDYGCGKGYLAKALPFPIWEYDPAIPEKAIAAAGGHRRLHRRARARRRRQGAVRARRHAPLFAEGRVLRDPPRAGEEDVRRRAQHAPDAAQPDVVGGQARKYFDVAKVTRKGPELHVVVGPKKTPP